MFLIFNNYIYSTMSFVEENTSVRMIARNKDIAIRSICLKLTLIIRIKEFLRIFNFRCDFYFITFVKKQTLEISHF